MTTSSFIPLLRTVDVLASSMLIGIPLWVFFLQSPLLFQFMGRDKFISPMMRLTDLLFRWTLPTCAAVSVACSILRNDADIIIMASGLLALASVLINALVVVPRALQAGKRATRTKDPTQSATAFAVDGGHATDTRTLHQTVVLFVVVMVVAAVGHVHLVVQA